MMKNITIGVLAILTVLSFLFGLVQQTEANRQRELADVNAKMAVENMEIAREQAKLAQKHAMQMQEEANRLRLIAEECARKKR